MKNIIQLAALLLFVGQMAIAQCNQPIPYVANIDGATPPTLPECMNTNWNMFSSHEVFKTIAGPVPGYTGR